LTDEITEKKDHIEKLDREIKDLQSNKADLITQLQETKKTLETTEQSNFNFNFNFNFLFF